MSANYFQASRLGNKSQKDEVNGMSRGARDRGAEQAGGGGSLYVQAPVGGVFISAPRPSAQVPALVLYSPTREAASKGSDILAPSQEFPWKTAWKQLPENHRVGGTAIFMSLSHHRIPWLFPHHKGNVTIASMGKQEVWAPNSLWGPQTGPSLL